ncbi:MAG: hypothetical protein O2992_05695 [Gemmatimonadetes bacterium]|nr:hypothetical protein [Gemmatimonadota bacterium]
MLRIFEHLRPEGTNVQRAERQETTTLKYVALRRVAIALTLFAGCSDSAPDSTGAALDAQPLGAGGRPAWLTDAIVDSVTGAMRQADARGEVPVGAAAILQTDTGQVILTAYNTVNHLGSASGHAEINAIQRVIEYLGSAEQLS